ncbi:hypothetical protein E2C01_018473 [Portunus trituberculatus]|uniref:Uncharacterized protein n=1 Tax=Portunus trituberculatus TaxID=210409 RepID=A0A5B7DX38_PORTR|nr:hypothetical protein [Portunus trituberculatus]
MVLLQGEGNSLRDFGLAKTAVKMLRESQGYEEMRQEANRKIQEGTLGMKLKTCREREDYEREDYGVSFLDLDNTLPLQAFKRDTP